MEVTNKSKNRQTACLIFGILSLVGSIISTIGAIALVLWNLAYKYIVDEAINNMAYAENPNNGGMFISEGGSVFLAILAFLPVILGIVSFVLHTIAKKSGEELLNRAKIGMVLAIIGVILGIIALIPAWIGAGIGVVSGIRLRAYFRDMGFY